MIWNRVRVAAGTVVWLADEALDRVPAYADWGDGRRWHARSLWGCALRLHRIWVPLMESDAP